MNVAAVPAPPLGAWSTSPRLLAIQDGRVEGPPSRLAASASSSTADFAIFSTIMADEGDDIFAKILAEEDFCVPEEVKKCDPRTDEPEFFAPTFGSGADEATFKEALKAGFVNPKLGGQKKEARPPKRKPSAALCEAATPKPKDVKKDFFF